MSVTAPRRICVHTGTSAPSLCVCVCVCVRGWVRMPIQIGLEGWEYWVNRAEIKHEQGGRCRLWPTAVAWRRFSFVLRWTGEWRPTPVSLTTTTTPSIDWCVERDMARCASRCSAARETIGIRQLWGLLYIVNGLGLLEGGGSVYRPNDERKQEYDNVNSSHLLTFVNPIESLQSTCKGLWSNETVAQYINMVIRNITRSYSGNF